MGSFHVKWLFTDLGFPIQLDKFLHKYPSNLLKNCFWAFILIGFGVFLPAEQCLYSRMHLNVLYHLC